MKYHKIRNVPLDVCTAEQVVAYNLAFRAHINYDRRFRQALDFSDACAFDLVLNIVHKSISSYMSMDNYDPKKRDVDAIQAALSAGLFDYMKNPFIASEYVSIGKAFPAHYLK